MRNIERNGTFLVLVPERSDKKMCLEWSRLFGEAVAEGACADAGRVDCRHHGTAGQDLFQHVLAVEASLDAVSEEREAEHNRCHNMAG